MDFKERIKADLPYMSRDLYRGMSWRKLSKKYGYCVNTCRKYIKIYHNPKQTKAPSITERLTAIENRLDKLSKTVYNINTKFESLNIGSVNTSHNQRKKRRKPIPKTQSDHTPRHRKKAK